jgi:glycosyltransferase involved in cell wall biosynthesis
MEEKKHTILVYATAASPGGGMSVLREFYDDVKAFAGTCVSWLFVTSVAEVEETENIKCLQFFWIKKSYFNRALFEILYLPYIIRKYRVDGIVSLQNMRVSFTRIKQIVCLHNVLPFYTCDKSSLSGYKQIVRQFFVNKKIRASLRNAHTIIVPAQWIKERIETELNVPSENITVLPMKIDKSRFHKCGSLDGINKTFFYPANAEPYKNHMVILEACKRLQQQGINDYNVIFTIKGIENAHAKILHKYVSENNLSITFHGMMNRDEVYIMYVRSVLLFPSTIETDALPVIEAKYSNAFIIAADLPYSSDSLNGYPNCLKFRSNDDEQLFDIMKSMIMGEYTIQTSLYPSKAESYYQAEKCIERLMIGM